MRKIAAAFTTAVCIGVMLPAAPVATAGNPIVATVAFGSPITDGTSPIAGAIALDTRTRRAFIAGGTANQLAMFDTDSGRLLHLFSMGTNVNSIDVDAGIGRVLVAVGTGSSRGQHDAVLVLDARNGRLLHRTSVGPSPYSVGLDLARHHLFVETSDTNGYHASLSTVDTTTGHVLRREPIGPSPSFLGLDQTHGRLFIETTDPNDYSGAISTVDTATGHMLHSVPFGARSMPVGPPQVVIDTARDRIFVVRDEASATSDDIVLAAIETRHGRLLHKVLVSTDTGFPASMIEDRRTGRVFASSVDGVLVLDAHNGAVLTRAAIEPAAGAMALDDQTDQVFVADAKGITILDARSGQQQRTVLPGAHVSYLVLDTRTRRIVGSGPDTLILLDARTDRLLQAPKIFGNDLTLTAVAGHYLITQNAGPTTFARVFDPATGALGPPIDLGGVYYVNTVDERRQRVFVAKTGTVEDNIFYDGDGAVGVLDARTGMMQDVVGEGSYPENVTVDPRSGAAFITDGLDDTATAFAPTFGRPRSSPQHALPAKPSFPLALPLSGSDVVVDERSGNAFIAIQTSAGGTANTPIGMIAGATGQLVHATVLGAYVGQAVDDPADGRIYVPVTSPNSLCILDAQTGRLVNRVPLPGPPGAIAVDPAEGHAIIAIAAKTSGKPGRVAILDTHRDAITSIQHVGIDPQAIGVDEGTERIFVANAGSRSISILDARTGALLQTTQVHMAPLAIAVSAATERVFVRGETNTQTGGEGVDMLDARTGRVMRTVLKGTYTYGNAIAVSAATGRVFVPDASLLYSTVDILDARTGAHVDTVTLNPGGTQGSVPVGSLAVDEQTRRVYVLMSSSPDKDNTWTGPGSVETLDARTGNVVQQASVRDTISGDRLPSALALDTRGHRLFALTDSTLVVLDTGHLRGF